MRAAAGRRPGRAAAGFLLPFLALFALCYLAPLCHAVWTGLHRTHRTGPLGQGRQQEVFAGPANYARALADDRFLAGFGRVLLFGAVQIPLMTVLATVLALLPESAAARWTAFFRAAFFLPYGVPGVIASILWGFLYVPGLSPLVHLARAAGRQVDFLSRGSVLWSLANIAVRQFTGYTVLVPVAQLKSVPAELYEAARLDGVNARQVARHVQLPPLRPALVLTTVFSIIGTLQLFAEPMVLRPLTSASCTSGTTTSCRW
ncbi:sugar ABC transporter permease [Streptomyces sp. RS10V-4]|uniref:carbohydrate ABC transporter permease n=1 Tax=Streptomyces rhizoryzae TaxID=2932493 RepID=UPI002004175D|nr:sugar ABC transporter permease [Streptomyces rhizoryzae]MCK7623493.1 sugar ABC transporter permease [Streptomyces rhizoryzae]